MMNKCLLCQESILTRSDVLDILGIRTTQPAVCTQCLTQFETIGERICFGCGRLRHDDTLCQDCQRWQSNGKQLLEHRALYRYNAAMKDYMQRYKFSGDYALRAVFRSVLLQHLKDYSDYIKVPIPISDQTWLTRGFNQVTGLLEGCHYQELLSVRAHQKAHQSQLNRQKRMTRKQPFELIDGTINLQGKSILLIDDIYTTGNTMYYAADLLYSVGAQVVRSVSLAR